MAETSLWNAWATLGGLESTYGYDRNKSVQAAIRFPALERAEENRSRKGRGPSIWAAVSGIDARHARERVVPHLDEAALEAAARREQAARS